MNCVLKFLFSVLVTFTSSNTIAQSTNSIFPFYSYGATETSFDDNSSITKIGDKKCYFNSYTFFIEKGAHFYVGLSSLSKLQIVIRNNNNSIDTSFYEDGTFGVQFQKLFIAPQTDSFTIFIVSLENLEKASYAFNFIEDRLYKNPIPVNAGFEDRLQTLIHYREMKFLPLKGKLISETPDMFTSIKKYAVNYELVKEIPVYYIESSLPIYLTTRISKADSKAKGIIQLNELKSIIDKYFAGDKIISCPLKTTTMHICTAFEDKNT